MEALTLTLIRETLTLTLIRETLTLTLMRETLTLTLISITLTLLANTSSDFNRDAYNKDFDTDEFSPHPEDFRFSAHYFENDKVAGYSPSSPSDYFRPTGLPKPNNNATTAVDKTLQSMTHDLNQMALYSPSSPSSSSNRNSDPFKERLTGGVYPTRLNRSDSQKMYHSEQNLQRTDSKSNKTRTDSPIRQQQRDQYQRDQLQRQTSVGSSRFAVGGGGGGGEKQQRKGGAAADENNYSKMNVPGERSYQQYTPQKPDHPICLECRYPITNLDDGFEIPVLNGVLESLNLHVLTEDVVVPCRLLQMRSL